MPSDDKYIIRPGGDAPADEFSSANGDMNEMASLEEYLLSNSILQSALVNLLVEKGIITLEDLNGQIDKIRNQM